jgi:hypothetical protein
MAMKSVLSSMMKKTVKTLFGGRRRKTVKAGRRHHKTVKAGRRHRKN